MKQITLFFIICVFFQYTKAQETFIIKTVNGDLITTNKIESLSDEPSSAEIKYISLTKKKSKEKWSFIDRSEVFSIQSPDNIETIIYSPLYEGDKTVAQMQMFLKGDAYARQFSNVGAFCIGFAGGLSTLAIKPTYSFLSPLPPLTTIILVNTFSPKIQMPKDDLDYFMDGYTNRRKKSNSRVAIWGAIAGTVVGVAGSFLVDGIGNGK